MECYELAAMYAMAVATLIMAAATFCTLKSDKKSHKMDRDVDALMHTYEHIISLYHLETEHWGELTDEKQAVLKTAGKEIFKRKEKLLQRVAKELEQE